MGFFEYVTPEKLKQMIIYVNEHKKDLGIDELISNVISKFKKEK